MLRQTVVALATVFFSSSFLAAQTNLVKLPPSPPDARAACSRFGEVRGQDAFAQTLLIKLDNGRMETVPFSRWTGFFKTSLELRAEKPLEIEPTDIRVFDRVCVVLDPSGATANYILVVEPVKAHHSAPDPLRPPAPSTNIAAPKSQRT
jgi:hypothetical protein